MVWVTVRWPISYRTGTGLYQLPDWLAHSEHLQERQSHWKTKVKLGIQLGTKRMPVYHDDIWVDTVPIEITHLMPQSHWKTNHQFTQEWSQTTQEHSQWEGPRETKRQRKGREIVRERAWRQNALRSPYIRQDRKDSKFSYRKSKE